MQSGKMCYKDERMPYNKNVIMADKKQQKK